jgi:hypothetical protein
MHRRSTGALALLATWQTAPARAAGEDIVMAPHRGHLRDVAGDGRGGTGVTAVSGRMVYELTGSACEGYTQNMRFVTQMVNQGGTSHDHRPALLQLGGAATASASASTPASTATRRRTESPPATPRAPPPPTTSRWS